MKDRPSVQSDPPMANDSSTSLLLSLSLFPLLSGLVACNPGTADAPAPTDSPKVEPAASKPPRTEPTPTPVLTGQEPTSKCVPPRTPTDCPTSRLVGRFPSNADCPPAYDREQPPKNAPRWIVEPMFASGDSRYCRYVWTGDPGSPAPLPKRLGSQLKPDCRVFAQSPLAAALTPAYERAFAEGTQPLATPPADGHPVVIAVVDTAPERTSLGQSDHGRAISAIVAKLASGCVTGLGDDPCSRSIITELGLPQTRTGPNAEQGGYFGYQSDLAEGIMAALERVQFDDRKLVLTLAVGWEPLPGETATPTPAVKAVRDAITIAHCRGAVVVAASGNRPPGNVCATQATAPGAWASEPGLTAAQCGLLGVDVNLPAPLHPHHPFLHAATPLDWDAGNLADFREGSNARLATTGFAGFVTHSGQSYGPMSGSSISTAAISGIAALVWSYFPDLSADALMQLIYQSGTATSQTASLSLSSLTQDENVVQHQVTACGAMQYACANWESIVLAHGSNPAVQPPVCDTLGDCPTSGPASVDTTAWDKDVEQALAQLPDGQVIHVGGLPWTTVECVGCNNQPRIVKLPPGVTSEPAEPAWVVPQPQAAPCPICKIKKPPNELHLSLDPAYDSHVLLELTLTLTDSHGATEVLYFPGTRFVPPLSSTAMQVITEPELATVGTSGSPPIRAHVKMKLQDPVTSTIMTVGNVIPLI